MNNVQLSGRLFSDPKGQYVKNGSLFVARFLLVVPRVMKKDAANSGKRAVDTIPCFILGGLAEMFVKNVGKGDKIIIDRGVWHVDCFKKNGKDVYTHSCWVLHFEFGTTKADSSLNDVNVVTNEELENIIEDLKLDSTFMEDM